MSLLVESRYKEYNTINAINGIICLINNVKCKSIDNNDNKYTFLKYL